MSKDVQGIERGKCACGGKLPTIHYLSWSATPTNGREPDDFQPRAQIKRLFEESKLVSGDSEAIRSFQINTLSLKSLWQSVDVY